MKKTTAIVWTTSMASLLGAVAHAADHGEHHGSIEWFYLGGQTFTFFVFVVGLYLLAKKPTQKFFLGRHEEVRTAVEEAQRAKADAEAKAREYETKMQDIGSELKKLAETFQAAAATEKQRLIEEAEHTAKRIAKDAEAVIATELEKAQAKLRQEAVEMALRMAEEILRREIKAEDQKRLVSEFTTLLSGQLNQKAA
jgi:F-type H+-transporting ATPase subunit b